MSLRNAELVFFFFLVIFGISVTWKASGHDTGIDFYQFWTVGQSLGRPGVAGSVYSDAGRARLGAESFEHAKQGGNTRLAAAAEYRKQLETYSTPLLYASFRLFSTGNYETDFRNYRLLLLACLAFAVCVLARLAGHPWTTTLGAVALFSTWFPAFTSDLRVGNVNSLQLASLAACVWTATRLRWRHREIAAGAILGLALAFKPNIAIVIVAMATRWIVDRRTRRLVHHLIGGTAAALLAVLFATVSFGSPRCWADWISAIRSIPGGIITLDLGNFSLARLLGDWFGFEMTIVLAVLFGGALLAVLLRTRRPLRAPADSGSARPASDALEESAVLSIGCLLLVIAPRLAWLHYYVFTIPMMLLLFAPMNDPPADSILWRRVLPGVALLALAIEPFQNIGIGITALTAAILVGVAAVLLFVTGLRRLMLLRMAGRQP